uniref:F-box domain-containing protein n=1 Tax=Acrobeloides nanus TaxID=290746 RepID=A0A914DMS2_9BILA
MKQCPTSIFCDVLSNLDYREVEDKRTVCDYWNKAIEKNPHTLPRLIFEYLQIRDGEVYGQDEIYDRALSYKEKYDRTWNFLDGNNYAKLDSCHFKHFLRIQNGENGMEILQDLCQRSGSKISIERIGTTFELFEDLKKLLPYTKVEEIGLNSVPSEVLLETPEKFFIPDQEIKRFIIITNDESTYEVDKIINLMAGNQCAIWNICVLSLNNASDELIASFAQNALQVFSDAVDIEPFVKEIVFHSGTIFDESSFKTDSIIDELIDQKVDYERQEITEPSYCGPQYAYLHTFKVRREDGWNLQMKLIKTVEHKMIMSCHPYGGGDITYTNWYVENCIFRDA